MREMAALLMSGQDGEMIDPHLASITGATLVMGTTEALASLRASEDLPVNPQRVADRDAAAAANLPDTFCEWLYSGERGASSDFIAWRVTGIPARASVAIPHDTGDFRRCLGVVEALKSHADEESILESLGAFNSQWQHLANNWATLKDMASKSGAQCCSFMQRIFRDGGHHA